MVLVCVCIFKKIDRTEHSLKASHVDVLLLEGMVKGFLNTSLFA